MVPGLYLYCPSLKKKIDMVKQLVKLVMLTRQVNEKDTFPFNVFVMFTLHRVRSNCGIARINMIICQHSKKEMA